MDLHNLDKTTTQSLTEKLEIQLEQARTFTSDIITRSSQIFEESPNLLSVRWVQYTPTWNDGDPCEFTVEDVSYKFSDSDDFLYIWELSYDIRNREPDTLSVTTEAQVDKLRSFSEFISDSEHLLEVIFGNNQQITINRDLSVEVEDSYYD